MTTVLTKTAKEDLERLATFIAETGSNQAKISFLQAFAERLVRLEQMPYMYQASAKDPDVRRCLIHKHAACYYRVTDEHIIILAVSDTRIDPADLPY